MCYAGLWSITYDCTFRERLELQACLRVLLCMVLFTNPDVDH